MPPKQLEETTMSKTNRSLIKVSLPKRNIVGADERRSIDSLVDTLMGKKADHQIGILLKPMLYIDFR